MSGAEDMRIDRFQLVDRIGALDMSDPKAPFLVAWARVPDEHSIFLGHFPGHPLMPGVLLAEFMAQSSGFLLLALNGFTRMPFLAALKEIKLRSFVLPGTELQCRVVREQEGSGYASMRATVARAGESAAVCDGTLFFRIVPYPKPGLREHMLVRAGEVGLAIGADGVVAQSRDR